MNPDTTQTSEEYVNRTLSRLQKSYRVTLTIAIIILAAEGIYLTVLNNKLASGLTVIGDYVENYQEDFDSIKKLAGQIPEPAKYTERIVQFEDALDNLNKAKDAKGVANLISQRIVNELNWQSDMITDYAQEQLGDVVFVELPKLGATVKFMGKMGEIESVKSVSDLFSPVSGEVIEVNERLLDHPEIANQDPFGEGWLIRVTMSDASEIDNLMTSEEYEAFTSGLS